MPKGSAAFASYIAQARQGSTAIWRLLAGLLLVAAAGALTAALLLAMLGNSRPSAQALPDDQEQALARLIETPVGIVIMSVSTVGLWLGVWLSLRLLHHRSLRSVLGATGRLLPCDILRGLAAALIATSLSTLAIQLVYPTLRRGSIAWDDWLLWLVPFLVLLLIGSSAWEVVFRGYFLQALAARFRSPLVWALLPAALNLAMVWPSQSSFWMNAVSLVLAVGMTAAATLLIYITGNISASIGVQFGNTLFYSFLVTSHGQFSHLALFVDYPEKAGGWTQEEIKIVMLAQLVGYALMLWLLLHRRSPLRVTPASF